MKEGNSKCFVFDGSVVNGLRQLNLYSFISNKPPGYEVFCEPVTFFKKNKNICFEYYNILIGR